MTQEELDALLDDDTSEAPALNPQDSTIEGGEDFRISHELSWPPPPPTTEHKVVHQLDDVTRDSEVKAVETFDKLEIMSNAASDIETAINKLNAFFASQNELLSKMQERFPDIKVFSEQLKSLEGAKEALSGVETAAHAITDASLEAMDIMQYQDIHRQKIERVINVMRALSRYMSSLFEGKMEDSKRVGSAIHIDGDPSEIVSDTDIESLISNFGASGNK